MQNSVLVKILLVSIFIFILTSCASSVSHHSTKLLMPPDWEIATRDNPELCVPIDDEFSVNGVGISNAGSVSEEARLDASLGYAYPTLNKPDTVRISIVEKSKLSTLHFGKPVSKSIEVLVSCEKGWWKMVQNMTNEYVGDGGKIDEATRTVFLAKSSDEALIIHVQANANYSSMVIFRHRVLSESWSKYDKL